MATQLIRALAQYVEMMTYLVLRRAECLAPGYSQVALMHVTNCSQETNRLRQIGV